MGKRGFYLNCPHFPLGPSFPTVGAEASTGCQQACEMPEACYQHEPRLPRATYCHLTGRQRPDYLVLHGMQPMSALEAVVDTTQSAWADVALP